VDTRPAIGQASGASAIVRDGDWRAALEGAVTRLDDATGGRRTCDLAFLFASFAYQDEFPALLRAVRAATGAAHVIGSSGWGVIGAGREIEAEPALALATVTLPGATLTPVRIDQRALEGLSDPLAWYAHSGLDRDEVGGWLVLADPFSLDSERLIDGLKVAFSDAPLIGGLASGDAHRRTTHLFLDDEVYDDGAVLLAVGGEWEILAVVSQGAEPIGETWTVTDADGHILRSIGGQPAYEVLARTLLDLPEPMRERAGRNLLIGLAMDEHHERYERGDFLIRNLLGGDRQTGELVVGTHPRVGQTIQFQVRDPMAADEELRLLLDRAVLALRGRTPAGALVCACNGRGVGLFGVPDHDAALVADRFRGMPIAGLFCNGEIGPVGRRPFLHGFTASIGLLVPKLQV
jgi:small ligand-binding sensory domain FIST